jgi:hypothetical protein
MASISDATSRWPADILRFPTPCTLGSRSTYASCLARPRAPFLGREGTGEETGGEIWDPLDIAGSVGDEALMWFRAAELKHGRVASTCPQRKNHPPTAPLGDPTNPSHLPTPHGHTGRR